MVSFFPFCLISTTSRELNFAVRDHFRQDHLISLHSFLDRTRCTIFSITFSSSRLETFSDLDQLCQSLSICFRPPSFRSLKLTCSMFFSFPIIQQSPIPIRWDLFISLQPSTLLPCLCTLFLFISSAIFLSFRKSHIIWKRIFSHHIPISSQYLDI